MQLEAVSPTVGWDQPARASRSPEITLNVGSHDTPAQAAEHTPADPTCGEGDLCQGESCCTRIAVPAGSYYDATARHQVQVADFVLDKYELTVGRVRRWLAAGAPSPRAGDIVGRESSGREIVWREGWRAQSVRALSGWARYDTFGGDPSLPKNFIDWYTATAVCHFAGGRLPNDAEWRYVAVGGEEARPFPWGSAPQTPERALYNCMGDGNQSCSLADILPVGSRAAGAGRWGHQDLVGSMFEWTADAAGSDRASRGGGFCYIGGVDRRVDRQRADANTRRDAPDTTSHMVGARCAFDVTDGHVTIAAR